MQIQKLLFIYLFGSSIPTLTTDQTNQPLLTISTDVLHVQVSMSVSPQDKPGNAFLAVLNIPVSVHPACVPAWLRKQDLMNCLTVRRFCHYSQWGSLCNRAKPDPECSPPQREALLFGQIRFSD